MGHEKTGTLTGLGAVHIVFLQDHFGSGIERDRQILTAKRSGISVWRGMASIRPVCELAQRECDPPSRFM